MTLDQCREILRVVEIQIDLITRRGHDNQKQLGPQQDEAKFFVGGLKKALDAEDLQVSIDSLLRELRGRHDELMARWKTTKRHETIRRYVTMSRLEAISQFAQLLKGEDYVQPNV